MGESETKTTLQRPYLLRAMHEWMTDNDLTPHIVIDVAVAGDSTLPLEYAQEGRLIINASYSATEHLLIGNERISFNARFGGVSRHLDVPIQAVVGVYARETGQGMIFSTEQPPEAGESKPDASPGSDAPGSDSTGTERDPRGQRPQLKVIK